MNTSSVRVNSLNHVFPFKVQRELNRRREGRSMSLSAHMASVGVNDLPAALLDLHPRNEFEKEAYSFNVLAHK